MHKPILAFNEAQGVAIKHQNVTEVLANNNHTGTLTA